MLSFTIDNASSLALGVRVGGPVHLPASRRVVEDIEVLGRAGTLTRLHGWEDTRIQIPIIIPGPDVVGKYQQLATEVIGSTSLRLSTQPGARRLVKHAHVSELEKEAASWGRCTAEFVCQPFTYLLDNPRHTVTARKLLTNPGNVASLPEIEVFGTGKLTFKISGQTCTVNSPAASITIDSQLQITHIAGKAATDGLIGPFPELLPGVVDVQPGTGVTRLEVRGNWRNL